VVSFTPQLLYPQYLSDRGLGGAQCKSGRCTEEKNMLFLPVIERRILDFSAYSSSLYRLSYPGFPRLLVTLSDVTQCSLIEIHRCSVGTYCFYIQGPMGIGGSSPGYSGRGMKLDHASPTSVEVKNMWIYTSTQPIHLHGMASKNRMISK
jgi:hypothetical protein